MQNVKVQMSKCIDEITTLVDNLLYHVYIEMSNLNSRCAIWQSYHITTLFLWQMGKIIAGLL